MKMRMLALVAILVGLTPFAVHAAKDRKLVPAADTPVKKKPNGKAAAARLRADWDMGELRMMRLVVDDAQFAPELKANLGDAIDKFAQQQEDLLAQVEADPSTEAAVQKKRAKLYAAYMEKMQVVYKNDAVKQDIARRMKALDREIDAIAASAEALMAKLAAVGVTKEQQDRIAPVIKDANKKVKAEVDKSETRSAKDKKNRDKVVASYKEARKKLRQELTPEQREKLTKKLAEEA
jgi:uncharacterized protein YajQ (UPF0234 family)